MPVFFYKFILQCTVTRGSLNPVSCSQVIRLFTEKFLRVLYYDSCKLTPEEEKFKKKERKNAKFLTFAMLKQKFNRDYKASHH